MRGIGACLLALAVAGCGPLDSQEKAARCAAAFRDYDASLRFDALAVRARNPGDAFARAETPTGGRRAAENALRQFDCISWPESIADLSDPRGQYLAYRNGPGGPNRAEEWLHLGAVFDRDSAEALTRFFAALGYRTETRYADRLGTRVYVGPVTSGSAWVAVQELAGKIGFPWAYFVSRVP